MLKTILFALTCMLAAVGCAGPDEAPERDADADADAEQVGARSEALEAVTCGQFAWSYHSGSQNYCYVGVRLCTHTSGESWVDSESHCYPH
jgi:hypothetical protein